MALFKTDLFRSFAIGFVLGAAGVVSFSLASSEKGLSGQVIPAAQAAPALADQTR